MSKAPHENSGDHVAALSALYQGEKTDASAIFNTAMTMMGVAGAYLIGAIPFVRKISEGPLPGPFLLLLPFPLWLIIAFHSLITLNAMSHGVSVKIIEDSLFATSGLGKHAKRDLVGSASADKIMDITLAKPIHKSTMIFVYGGLAALVIMFTIYSLYSAVGLVQLHTFVMVIVGYASVVLMVLASWIAGIRMIGKERKNVRP